jgi:hypothetical protein
LPLPAPAVAWEIEKMGPEQYRLWNVGTEVATGVAIDMARAPALLDLDLGDGTARPDLPISLVITEYAEAPKPEALRVSWDGQAEPISVPVP